MTSPPYYSSELDSTELSQSSITFVNHEEGREGLLARTMHTSANSGYRANRYQGVEGEAHGDGGDDRGNLARVWTKERGASDDLELHNYSQEASQVGINIGCF
jgi:hypothetical protein